MSKHADVSQPRDKDKYHLLISEKCRFLGPQNEIIDVWVTGDCSKEKYFAEWDVFSRSKRGFVPCIPIRRT